MIKQLDQVLILKDLLNIPAWEDELPWEPFRPGVDIYRLYGDGYKGAAAALLRYQPGASVPKHDHTGFEHIFVLSLEFRLRRQGAPHWETVIRAKKLVKFASANRE